MRILSLFLFGVISTVTFGVQLPTMKLGNTEWWRARQGKEVLDWTDVDGRLHRAFRAVGTTNDVIASDRSCKVVFTYDFKVKSVSITSAPESYIGNLSKIAPGTYDLINDKWWSDMTDVEKLAMWDAYKNKLIAAEEADRKARYAPAKFDVSMSVDEYKASLLEGRDTNTLTKVEWRELNSLVSLYKDEKERVDDPENWRRLPLPSMLDKRTERQKMGRRFR